MSRVSAICLPCRLRILSKISPHSTRSHSSRPSGLHRLNSSLVVCRRARLPQNYTSKRQASTDIDKEQRPNEDDIVGQASTATQEQQELDFREIARSLDPEAVARHARQRFGDRLPEGALNENEYRIYERFFGKPPVWSDDIEEGVEEEGDVIIKEREDGTLEEIQLVPEVSEERQKSIPGKRKTKKTKDNYVLDKDIIAAMETRSEENEDATAEQLLLPDQEIVAEVEAEELRAHPFTIASRSGTHPSSLMMPKETMTGPVSILLADIANKHLDESSQKIFGGPGLPYASGSPIIAHKMPQKPIPLSAYHGRMTSMEADLYVGTLYPGFYASIMSVLVETRRRIGGDWLHDLLKKGNGPRILDAGAGGAGVLAWREILKAEWRSKNPNSAKPAPLGKATVLTSSDALRQRASILLENTTFLPRLPDYLHTQFEEGAQRKQYDIIVAPHSLWTLQEDYMRRRHIDNLWSLLNPDGGVLILLEKGVPRGFEVIAGARQHLLNTFIAPTSESSLTNDESANEVDSNASTPQRHTARALGAIIAPCTTHSKCPMYRIPGLSRQRKDFCHFSQRYLRPIYLQRLLGGTSRNHEDVPFSYIAVQRGVSPVQLGSVGSRPRLMGAAASDRAFEGYDVDDADLAIASESSFAASVSARDSNVHSEGYTPGDAMIPTPPASAPPHALTLPRVIYQPLKRHGHVMMDVCTPAGQLERWTVPKSYGRQAYRDARKSAWGDLWPLGAKLRVPRTVRVGLAEEKVRRGVEASEEDDGKGKEAIKLRGRAKARFRKREEGRALTRKETSRGKEAE